MPTCNSSWVGVRNDGVQLAWRTSEEDGFSSRKSRSSKGLASISKIDGTIPFAHVDGAVREIPSLGKDFTKAYGYAQEHYTLELYLQLSLAHTKDVLLNGTSTHCRRLIDLVFSYWNKCMGNVDIVRKVLKKRKAVRGPNSGPGSLIWFELVGYTFYDAFRLYQHGQLEQSMQKFSSFKQFQKARQKITFTHRIYFN